MRGRAMFTTEPSSTIISCTEVISTRAIPSGRRAVSVDPPGGPGGEASAPGGTAGGRCAALTGLSEAGRGGYVAGRRWWRSGSAAGRAGPLPHPACGRAAGGGRRPPSGRDASDHRRTAGRAVALAVPAPAVPAAARPHRHAPLSTADEGDGFLLTADRGRGEPSGPQSRTVSSTPFRWQAAVIPGRPLRRLLRRSGASRLPCA